MTLYNISSPRLGIDHGEWSGETDAHALAAMLTANGYAAQAVPATETQAALFDAEPERRWFVVVEPDALARMSRVGLEIRAFRVLELRPIPAGLFR